MLRRHLCAQPCLRRGCLPTAAWTLPGYHEAPSLGRGRPWGLSQAPARCPNHRRLLPLLGPLSSGELLRLAVPCPGACRGGEGVLESSGQALTLEVSGFFPFLPRTAPLSATASTCPCPRAPWTRSCSLATAVREQRLMQEGSLVSLAGHGTQGGPGCSHTRAL